MFLLLVGLLVLIGCASVGYRADSVQMNHFSLNQACKFYVKEVEATLSSSSSYSPSLVAAKTVTQSLSVQRINRRLSQAQPNLFSFTEKGIPLYVLLDVNSRANSLGRIAGALVCGGTFGLIPTYLKSDYVFNIELETMPYELFGEMVSTSTSVQRCGLLSLMPTAYLPVLNVDIKEIINPLVAETRITEAGKDFIAEQIGLQIINLITDIPENELKRMHVLWDYRER